MGKRRMALLRWLAPPDSRRQSMARAVILGVGVYGTLRLAADGRLHVERQMDGCGPSVTIGLADGKPAHHVFIHFCIDETGEEIGPFWKYISEYLAKNFGDEEEDGELDADKSWSPPVAEA